MLSQLTRARVLICREPMDMRKSFSGLSGAVRSILSEDPLSGHLFCFFNRRRNYVKLLYWDGTGYCIFAKRLVRGTFSSLSAKEIDVPTLQQLLAMVELSSVRSRAKYKYISDD